MISPKIAREVADATERRRDEIISFLQDLVRIPSVVGDEEKIQAFMNDTLRRMGLKTDVWEPDIARLRKHPSWIRTKWNYHNRPNVVGTLKGGGKGRSIILIGHTDTVEVGRKELWKHDPFGGETIGGKLYGRGSLDMKQGIAAMTKAVEIINDSGILLNGNVILESVPEEEAGGAGALDTILKGYRAEAAINPEPSGLKNVWLGTAGVNYFRVKVSGRSVHAGMAHLGVSALLKTLKICDALMRLDERRARVHRNEMFEKTWGRSCNLNIGIMKSGNWPSSVPENAEIECRLSFLPDENMLHVRREVANTIKEVAKSDPWLVEHPPKVEWYGWKAEASEISQDEPIIRVLSKHAKETVGMDVEYSCSPFGADMRFFPLYAKPPIPCFMYGAGGGNMHGVDEYVNIDDVIDLTKIFAMTILDWCGIQKSDGR